MQQPETQGYEFQSLPTYLSIHSTQQVFVEQLVCVRLGRGGGGGGALNTSQNNSGLVSDPLYLLGVRK